MKKQKWSDELFNLLPLNSYEIFVEVETMEIN